MAEYKRGRVGGSLKTRCYLTLSCNGNCDYCSANIPMVSESARQLYTPPEIWIEGINRRQQDCILAGGEPFMYPYLAEIVNGINVRSQIYSNMKVDVTEFLHKVGDSRPEILASCHIMTDSERELWVENVRKMIAAGFNIRYHVVKVGDWQDRVDFIQCNNLGPKITVCDDQRVGIRSAGRINDVLVTCRNRIYIYAPDGFRYPCATLMGKVSKDFRLEHISEPDSGDWQTVDGCILFGNCCGCDNLLEGETIIQNVSLWA